ncbi:hypothetical protein BN2497_12935 [Janthinobacterium sp. CG23_2]|nr:hypothetical protein BN2497_12935 [Janthinobacterium sp. CG23_2]CUU32865.1 hypothetical protein BN3177_12935 [Janthinobacterium sp. CG23_2]
METPSSDEKMANRRSARLSNDAGAGCAPRHHRGPRDAATSARKLLYDLGNID